MRTLNIKITWTGEKYRLEIGTFVREFDSFWDMKEVANDRMFDLSLEVAADKEGGNL